MITRKEAIKKALAFEPVTPVPYNLDFTKDMRDRLREHYGQDDVDETVGNYILQVNVGSNAGAEVNRVAGALMEPLGNHRYQDEFGVIWDKSGGDDIGIPANQVLAKTDADLLRVPDPADPMRWRGYEDVLATAGDRYVLVCFSSPLFQRAWFLRGMAEWLMDMAMNEGFVNAVLDRLTDFSIALVRQVARRGGADGIFFYDDYAQQTGLLFSPDMFRRNYAPRLAKIFGTAKDCGLDVFFHSCGDVSSVLEDILSAGANVFNPFQPEVMDVEGVARRFTGRLAFYGGISTQHTLPYGTPDEVRREVAHRLSIFRDTGGYILAAAHAIQRDVPLDNVLALLDAARNP